MADLETSHATIDHTGLTGVGGGGGGLYVQRIAGQLTSQVDRTAASMAASGLAATITPANGAVLEIEVEFEANASVQSGSPTTVLGIYEIYDSTAGVVVASRAVGALFASAPGVGTTIYDVVHLLGVYTAPSGAARTFQLRHQVSTATTTQSSIRGDRAGGARMVIRELA